MSTAVVGIGASGALGGVTAVAAVPAATTPSVYGVVVSDTDEDRARQAAEEAEMRKEDALLAIKLHKIHDHSHPDYQAHVQWDRELQSIRLKLLFARVIAEASFKPNERIARSVWTAITALDECRRVLAAIAGHTHMDASALYRDQSTASSIPAHSLDVWTADDLVAIHLKQQVRLINGSVPSLQQPDARLVKLEKGRKTKIGRWLSFAEETTMDTLRAQYAALATRVESWWKAERAACVKRLMANSKPKPTSKPTSKKRKRESPSKKPTMGTMMGTTTAAAASHSVGGLAEAMDRAVKHWVTAANGLFPPVSGPPPLEAV